MDENNINICCCGAQASYPHAVDCPYPHYRSTASSFMEWEEARRKMVVPRHCEVCGALMGEMSLDAYESRGETCDECAEGEEGS